MSHGPTYGKISCCLPVLFVFSIAVSGCAGSLSSVREIILLSLQDSSTSIGGQSAKDFRNCNHNTPNCGAPGIGTDTDNDGIPDQDDNCPQQHNPDQGDNDYLKQVRRCKAPLPGDFLSKCDFIKMYGAHGNNVSITPCEDGFCSVFTCTFRDSQPSCSEQQYSCVPLGDGVGDVCDNCPSVRNWNQADSDADGIGDACDSSIYTTGAVEYVCGAWHPSKPNVARGLFDIVFGLRGPGDPGLGPDQADLAKIQNANGVIVHQYNLTMVRALLAPDAIPALGANHVHGVADECDLLVQDVIVSYKASVTTDDLVLIRSLGGTVVRNLGTSLLVTIPDSAIPELRRQPQVEYVELDLIRCLM